MENADFQMGIEIQQLALTRCHSAQETKELAKTLGETIGLFIERVARKPGGKLLTPVMRSAMGDETLGQAEKTGLDDQSSTYVGIRRIVVKRCAKKNNAMSARTSLSRAPRGN